MGNVRQVLILLHDTGVTLKFEDMLNLYELHRLPRPCYSPWAPRSMKTLNWPHKWTRISAYNDGTLIISRPVQLIPPLGVELCPNRRSLEEVASESSIADLWRINRRWNTCFRDVQSEISGTAVSALSCSQGSCTIGADTLDRQFTCVFLRTQPDVVIKPIGYWSWSLNDAEGAYVTTYPDFL